MRPKEKCFSPCRVTDPSVGCSLGTDKWSTVKPGVQNGKEAFGTEVYTGTFLMLLRKFHVAKYCQRFNICYVWPETHYTALWQLNFRKCTNQNAAVIRNFSLLKRNVHCKYMCFDNNEVALSTK